MPTKKRGSPLLYKGMKSLNPNGRPKGSVNKFTALSRELMSNKGPEIVQKVIDLALEGDRTCLKMCMDRIIPTTKAVEFRSSEDRGNVIINVSGLEAKKLEIEEKDNKELTYEDGVVIDEEVVDETIVTIGKALDG
jgi:hypothetical protein|tara:strand:- start:353 stop:760 length:408 start_codon:yes stop_codon:yes gene_type:complete